MSESRLGRFYSILQTPFDADGAIDCASLVRLLRHRETCGCDALFLLGVASEVMFLSRSEQEEVVGLIMRELGGRRPVLVAAYAPAAAAVVELGRRWTDLGASGVVVLPPYAAAPTDDAVVRHYAAVTDALDVPVIVQDEPNTSGITMSAALLARLAREVDGVAAFKVEGQPVTQRLSAVRALVGDTRPLYSAAGTSFVQELERGSSGMMTGYPYPEVIVETLELFHKGDAAGANALWDRLMPLTAMDARPGLMWAVRKEILKRRGLIGYATVRDPAPAIDAETRDEIGKLIDRLELAERYPVD
ncbi:MAG: dihydrodipicolinate synthase family protein [Chloroflexi bacterium]|nr:dihydrodipicolinate synthase family protein [Chloroflexota bacterium]